jgi:hypothetical protein
MRPRSARSKFIPHRFRRAADLAGSRDENDAIYPVVYGDPRHRGQTGSGNLAPEGCFKSAETIERVVGQIGETQKATPRSALGSTADSKDLGTELATASVLSAMRCDAGSQSKLTESARPNPADRTGAGVDYFQP